ncbi:MAG TPA: glycosyltransferase family 39 protein [Nitrospirota bacterium]|nr:glycosyltransferase family 39 protein [Nitrospirota bacterium]
MRALREKISRILAGKHFNLIAFGIITVLILIAYSNTFKDDFNFDDNPTIVDNLNIKRLNWDTFIGSFSGTRPIVNLSLLLNYALSGLNVIGWHIFNISCHIANSIFVYLFILWTLELPALRDRYAYRSRRMALFGALLFALHPIQTEAVTYIISRTELIATFFYLATILFFINGARTGKFAYFIGSVAMAALAMGSKEWAVTLPAMLILYDFLFLSNSKFKPVLSRLGWHALVALSWSVLIYDMSTTQMNGVGFGISGQKGITPLTYLLTSLNVLWTYMRLLILPINQNLDYGYPLAKTLFEFPTMISFIAHVGVVAVSIWLYVKKRWTLIPFGFAWFYIALSPTQSFVPILDVIFEHRVYMPSIGLIIFFIAAFEEIMDAWDRKMTAARSSSPA